MYMIYLLPDKCSKDSISYIRDNHVHYDLIHDIWYSLNADGEKYFKWGNPDPKGQMLHVYMRILASALYCGVSSMEYLWNPRNKEGNWYEKGQ